MPPFRLLHVAGLDLDAVIARPPAGMDDLCETTSRRLLQRIVDIALERNVDAVLLIPAIGPDGLPEVLCLASLEALHELVESLASREIQIVIALAGNLSLWRRLVGQNGNLHLLAPGDRIRLNDRHGGARVELHGMPSPGEPRPAGGSSHWSVGDGARIAVAPSMSLDDLDSAAIEGCAYLALGDGPRQSRRIEGALVNSPGRPQGTGRRDTGPHGATLLQVDGGGHVEADFVSTASVRFESIAVEADGNDDLDDLALRMLESLSAIAAEPGERGWIVSWTVRASGRLLERIESRRGRSDLLALLPGDHQGRELCHELTIVPAADAEIDLPFAAEFRAALEARRADLGSNVSAAGLAGVKPDRAHHQRIGELLAACDDQSVFDQAMRHGLRMAAAVRRDLD